MDDAYDAQWGALGEYYGGAAQSAPAVDSTPGHPYDCPAYDALVLSILDMADELQSKASDLRNIANMEAEILEARADDLLDLINGNRE